jgi:hypothetical protein
MVSVQSFESHSVGGVHLAEGMGRLREGSCGLILRRGRKDLLCELIFFPATELLGKSATGGRFACLVQWTVRNYRKGKCVGS